MTAKTLNRLAAVSLCGVALLGCALVNTYGVAKSVYVLWWRVDWTVLSIVGVVMIAMLLSLLAWGYSVFMWRSRRWIFLDRVHARECGHCGYDLRASPHLCPECGHDPGEPFEQHFPSPLPTRRGVLRLVLGLGGIIVIGFLVTMIHELGFCR
jgi:hypothetical protein